MKAKELRQYLDKFLISPSAQQARVQIELPNGEKINGSKDCTAYLAVKSATKPVSTNADAM